MNYHQAWLELKSTIESMKSNSHNSMTSLTEGVWTESVTNDILKKMENIENGMLRQSGLERLVAIKEEGVKLSTLKGKQEPKKLFLVKFKRSPIMQGHYGALVVTNGNKRSLERTIARTINMLSTNVLSANIESIQEIGNASDSKRECIILTEQEYHRQLVKHKSSLN